MKSFKQWLIKEDIAHDLDATGDLFYPTTGGEYLYASSEPMEHWWLQYRWDQEKSQGRKFHNIDQKEFDQRKYVTIQSTEMPDAGDGFWEHKPKNKPSVKIVKFADFVSKGVAKDSKTPKILKGKPLVKIQYNWKNIFGDDGKPGKWPEAAVDKEWKR